MKQFIDKIKNKKDLTIFKQLPDWSGLPGPGEITILLYFFFNISLDVIWSFRITSTLTFNEDK